MCHAGIGFEVDKLANFFSFSAAGTSASSKGMSLYSFQRLSPKKEVGVMASALRGRRIGRL
jgi:hypothetical protein